MELSHETYLSFFQSLREFIARAEILPLESIKGYSEKEIAQYGGALGADFPEAYLCFQMVMGNPETCFTQRGDYGVHVIQSSQEHQKDFVEDERWQVQIPDNALTFMHEPSGEGILFFMKGQPNPPVYAYYANWESQQPFLVQNTFSSFIREDIIETLESTPAYRSFMDAIDKDEWNQKYKWIREVRGKKFMPWIEKQEQEVGRFFSIAEVQEKWLSFYRDQVSGGLEEIAGFVPYGWTEMKMQSPGDP